MVEAPSKCIDARLRGYGGEDCKPEPDVEAKPFAAAHQIPGREESNDYPGVVAQLSESVRVIDCRNHLQWIVQRRKGRLWRSVSYCRERESLIRVCGQYASFRALPPRHPSEHHEGPTPTARELRRQERVALRKFGVEVQKDQPILELTNADNQ